MAACFSLCVLESWVGDSAISSKGGAGEKERTGQPLALGAARAAAEPRPLSEAAAGGGALLTGAGVAAVPFALQSGLAAMQGRGKKSQSKSYYRQRRRQRLTSTTD